MGDVEGTALGQGEGLADGHADGDVDGSTVGDAEGDTLGHADGLGLNSVGLVVGDADGLALGAVVGASLGPGSRDMSAAKMPMANAARNTMPAAKQWAWEACVRRRAFFLRRGPAARCSSANSGGSVHVLSPEASLW